MSQLRFVRIYTWTKLKHAFTTCHLGGFTVQKSIFVAPSESPEWPKVLFVYLNDLPRQYQRILCLSRSYVKEKASFQVPRFWAALWALFFLGVHFSFLEHYSVSKCCHSWTYNSFQHWRQPNIQYAHSFDIGMKRLRTSLRLNLPSSFTLQGALKSSAPTFCCNNWSNRCSSWRRASRSKPYFHSREILLEYKGTIPPRGLVGTVARCA